MKMNELTPGVYKIRKIDYQEKFGAKHPRTNPNEVHLLRVIRKGKILQYFLDHDITVGERLEDFNFADYEIISHYEKGYPQIRNCVITLSFEDEAGQKFSFRVGDAWVLRGVFDTIDWLRKPFGFEPRKKKI